LAVVPAGAIVTVPDAWWTSGAVMVAAWTAWASVYTVRFVWAMVALRRARARSRAFPTQLESVLSHWRDVRDEGRRTSLMLSEAVTAAAVLGCGTPVIAVAPSLVTTLNADELDRVLIHEWAHVQRRDDLVNLLHVFVRVVAGWHPAVWWIERRLHVEREIACDEMTIEVTGSAKSYAACLVKLAELRAGERTAWAAPAVLASGLRERVRRIVSRGSFIGPMWSRGIATAIVSALCLVSVAVSGQALVEATVLALPFGSLRAIGTGLDRVVAVAMPTFASPVASVPAPGKSAASTQPARRPIAEEPPPVTAAAALPEVRHPSVPESPIVSTELQATAAGGAETDAVPAAGRADPEKVLESSALVAAMPMLPPRAASEDGRSVWRAAADGGTAIGRTAADGGTAIGRTAADGGTAIGRKSKEAGVATAGFFTRVARRVAGAF
jgi:beta-lactamase regulating signal transducer with metallopeptidase domain